MPGVSGYTQTCRYPATPGTFQAHKKEHISHTFP